MEWQDALMRYLLDSDTCIFALRDNLKVMQKLMQLPSHQWGISSLTAFELQRGVARGLRTDVAEQTKNFIEAAQVVEFGRAQAKPAAEIEHHLVRAGKSVGVVDILIAAHAISLGLTLVTNNTKHFENVPGLKLENWV